MPAGVEVSVHYDAQGIPVVIGSDTLSFVGKGKCTTITALGQWIYMDSWMDSGGGGGGNIET